MASVLTTTFNSEAYQFSVMLSHYDPTAPDDTFGTMFESSDIYKLILERDLNNYYTRGQVLINDTDNVLASLALHDGTWLVYINIGQQSAISEEVPNSEIKKSFLVTGVDIKAISDKGTLILIYFSDLIEQVLYKKVAYSSQSNTDISTVLTGLLEKTGFNSSSDGTTLPEINACGRTTNFITDCNTPVIYNIDNLVSQIYSGDNGFLFLYKDIFAENLNAYWTTPVINISDELMTDISNQNDGAYVYSIIIGNNKDNPNTTGANAAELTQDNPNAISYTNAVQLITPTYINKFSYTDNKNIISEDGTLDYEQFKEYYSNYTDSALSPLVPNTVENTDSLIDINKQFIQNANPVQVGRYFNETNEEKLYRELRTYFINYNSICIKVLGATWRKVGYPYSVIYNNSVSAGRLTGTWFCTRIVDEFKDREFYQYIFLSRAADYVNYSNSKTKFEKRIDDVTS